MDKRLLPYIEERARAAERRVFENKLEAALLRVYGPPEETAKPQPPAPRTLTYAEKEELFKAETRLLKASLLLQRIRKALDPARHKSCPRNSMNVEKAVPGKETVKKW